jgi:hypothetical protein
MHLEVHASRMAGRMRHENGWLYTTGVEYPCHSLSAVPLLERRSSLLLSVSTPGPYPLVQQDIAPKCLHGDGK